MMIDEGVLSEIEDAARSSRLPKPLLCNAFVQDPSAYKIISVTTTLNLRAFDRH